MSATQSSFNFSRPRSRRSGPDSSRRAAERLDRNGTMRGQRKLTLDLIKHFPGLSTKQLGDKGTLDRYQIARRARELQSLGFILEVGDSIRKSDLRWYAVIQAVVEIKAENDQGE